VGDQFERMLEMMMSNPTVMEMMMSRMPLHMRQPEVLKAMMANPEVRARMSALAQEKVRAHCPCFLPEQLTRTRIV
jgi:hypothetical protein